MVRDDRARWFRRDTDETLFEEIGHFVWRVAFFVLLFDFLHGELVLKCHVGLFGCKQKYVRQMPGRLCGETVDAAGKRGFVLTLSTREQHIRREKATSNICTNSGLCTLAFTIHMSLLGETVCAALLACTATIPRLSRD